MYVTGNVENVEEARPRRMVEYGGARSAQTRAVPGRLARSSGRLTRRRSGLGSSWTRVTSNIAGACLLLEEGMRKAAPAEYRPDRRSMALVPEMEETGEEVDDPTPELSRRHAARRGML
jgi:hypothetical protein